MTTRSGRKPGSKNLAPYVRGNIDKRFEAHLDKSAPFAPNMDTPCWRWIGRQIKGGYCQINVGGKNVMAHRWSYERFVGPIPGGLTIDHLCRVANCVNPAHLEAVTQRENNLRSEGLTARNVAATHCPLGHPYDEANTYHMPAGGRDCRECINRRSREYKARLRGGSAVPKTHCPQGHPYDEGNTYHSKSSGRMCRECMRIRSREYQRAKRAEQRRVVRSA